MRDRRSAGTNHQQLGPLQDGETCHMEIDKIGGFDFHIVDPYKRSWLGHWLEHRAGRAREDRGGHTRLELSI